MKRIAIAALLPLMVGGCLPLPIAIASSAFTGVSYLTSGKSTSDHVLSAAMEQDCALTRPVIGEPFCRDIGPDGEGRTPALTVAYYPGDRDEVLSPDERTARWQRGAFNLDAESAQSRQIAATPQFLAPVPRVTVAGIILTKEQVVPAPNARALPIAADTGWRSIGPAAAGMVGRTAKSAPPSAATLPATPALQVPMQQSGNRKAATPGLGADHWVVLGSFRSTDRARVMAARYSEQDPSILPATVKGGQWHRVAVGPMAPSAARSLRNELGMIDGRSPWVVRHRVN
ncbi:SPOR domain-containing protein [Thalassobaculum sp.]|uniref:SPOR domain-containing protein n=1 Tax=Thalassobaculum sp. TaxID=2022740 RepID=UPI0032EF383D